ncbi:MAG: hypothetical protein ACERJ1_09335 [Halodesulfovibrio sp.]
MLAKNRAEFYRVNIPMGWIDDMLLTRIDFATQEPMVMSAMSLTQII